MSTVVSVYTNGDLLLQRPLLVDLGAGISMNRAAHTAAALDDVLSVIRAADGALAATAELFTVDGIPVKSVAQLRDGARLVATTDGFFLPRVRSAVFAALAKKRSDEAAAAPRPMTSAAAAAAAASAAAGSWLRNDAARRGSRRASVEDLAEPPVPVPAAAPVAADADWDYLSPPVAQPAPKRRPPPPPPPPAADDNETEQHAPSMPTEAPAAARTRDAHTSVAALQHALDDARSWLHGSAAYEVRRNSRAGDLAAPSAPRSTRRFTAPSADDMDDSPHADVAAPSDAADAPPSDGEEQTAAHATSDDGSIVERTTAEGDGSASGAGASGKDDEGPLTPLVPSTDESAHLVDTPPQAQAAAAAKTQQPSAAPGQTTDDGAAPSSPRVASEAKAADPAAAAQSPVHTRTASSPAGAAPTSPKRPARSLGVRRVNSDGAVSQLAGSTSGSPRSTTSPLAPRMNTVSPPPALTGGAASPNLNLSRSTSTLTSRSRGRAPQEPIGPYEATPAARAPNPTSTTNSTNNNRSPPPRMESDSDTPPAVTPPHLARNDTAAPSEPLHLPGRHGEAPRSPQQLSPPTTPPAAHGPDISLLAPPGRTARANARPAPNNRQPRRGAPTAAPTSMRRAAVGDSPAPASAAASTSSYEAVASFLQSTIIASADHTARETAEDAATARQAWAALFSSQGMALVSAATTAARGGRAPLFVSPLLERLQLALYALRGASWGVTGCLRVFVAGPRSSGRSTALAVIAGELLHPMFDQPAARATTLTVPLNFASLLPNEENDVAIFYCRCVQHFVHCVVAHRPALRPVADAMTAFWKGAVTRRSPPVADPRLLDALPDEVSAWALLVERIQHGYHTGNVAAVFARTLHVALMLRDTLGFTTLLHVVDGTDALENNALVDWRSGSRSDGHAHVTELAKHLATTSVSCFAVMPQPPASPDAAVVHMCGLVDDAAALEEAGLPQHVAAGGRTYPLAIFGGCPGFLAKLAVLARSAHAGAATGVLHMTDAAAGGLLEELASLGLEEHVEALRECGAIPSADE